MPRWHSEEPPSRPHRDRLRIPDERDDPTPESSQFAATIVGRFVERRARGTDGPAQGSRLTARRQGTPTTDVVELSRSPPQARHCRVAAAAKHPTTSGATQHESLSAKCCGSLPGT